MEIDPSHASNEGQWLYWVIDLRIVLHTSSLLGECQATPSDSAMEDTWDVANHSVNLGSPFNFVGFFSKPTAASDQYPFGVLKFSSDMDFRSTEHPRSRYVTIGHDSSRCMESLGGMRSPARKQDSDPLRRGFPSHARSTLTSMQVSGSSNASRHHTPSATRKRALENRRLTAAATQIIPLILSACVGEETACVQASDLGAGTCMGLRFLFVAIAGSLDRDRFI